MGSEAVEGPVGVQRVAGDPGDRAQHQDDRQGRGPDEHFEPGRMMPVGGIGRGRVRGAVLPGEEQGQHNHRHDDQQHQPRGQQQQIALLRRDIACRFEHDHFTAGHARQQRRGQQRLENSHVCVVLVAIETRAALQYRPAPRIRHWTVCPRRRAQAGSCSPSDADKAGRPKTPRGAGTNGRNGL